MSPALPVGAYHFSQGLEYAAHIDCVRDETTAYEWIAGIANNAVGTLDIPVLLRLCDAWRNDELESVAKWTRFLVASRETQELRAEERHMGKALAKVLVELQIASAQPWIKRDDTTYAAMFALAATSWDIECAATANAYLWAWCENQVLAALKLLPIGQSAGQRILNRLLPAIPDIVDRACTLDDEDIGIATPLHAVGSAKHETQYSRLFRS